MLVHPVCETLVGLVVYSPLQLIPRHPFRILGMQGRSQGPFALSKVLQWSAFHPIKEVFTSGNPLPDCGVLLTKLHSRVWLQLCALLCAQLRSDQYRAVPCATSWLSSVLSTPLL